MFTHVVEAAMTLLLSLLMALFFIILAPFWTLFYGGVLLKDFVSIVRA